MTDQRKIIEIKEHHYQDIQASKDIDFLTELVTKRNEQIILLTEERLDLKDQVRTLQATIQRLDTELNQALESTKQNRAWEKICNAIPSYIGNEPTDQQFIELGKTALDTWGEFMAELQMPKPKRSNK